MKLTVALVGTKETHVTPNHKIAIYLTKNNAIIPASYGEDQFTYNAMRFADTPLTATGRTVTHNPQFDLLAYQGVAGVPVKIDKDDLKTLDLVIETNLILDQGELQTYYRLAVQLDEREIPLPLYPINWDKRGTFLMRDFGKTIQTVQSVP